MSTPVAPPRLAVLCASSGRVHRGIETAVDELCLKRLGARYPLDLYGPPEAPPLPPPHRVIRIPCRHRDSAGVGSYDAWCRLLHWPMTGGHNYEVWSYAWRLLDSLFFSQPYRAVFNFAGPYAGLLCKLKRWFDGSRFIHLGQAGIGPVEVMQAALRPDRYIPLSEPARDWLVTKGLLGPGSMVIPNGVDTGLFHPGVPPACRLSHPVVLFAGALDEMKRPLLTVAAVAQAGGSLLVAGDGPLREAVLRHGEQVLGDRFRYLGEVDRDGMPALFASCDVFTLPSFAEPFGIVLLEAMACGKPVVTHDDAIRRWLVADAGLLCDCTAVGAYADALSRAAAEEWRGRPRARAELFSWDRIAECYMELLQEIEEG